MQRLKAIEQEGQGELELELMPSTRARPGLPLPWLQLPANWTC
jgi:hypothetical protein